jgi:hypothetical protein
LNRFAGIDAQTWDRIRKTYCRLTKPGRAWSYAKATPRSEPQSSPSGWLRCGFRPPVRRRLRRY